MGKRFRHPRVKDGELKLYWGKLSGMEPDICTAWEGIDRGKRDSNLMLYVAQEIDTLIKYETLQLSRS